MKQSVLVTGGCGFIGSHTVKLLLAQGYEVTVIDDLRQWHPDSVPEGALVDLNLFDTQELMDLMQDRHCTSVLHLAASTSVAESMLEPGVYFNNNVAGSLSLLQAMLAAGVTRLVFSSSAAVYGNPPASPIREFFPTQPVNPYGESKAMVEQMLHWYHQCHGLSTVSLRYFNAAGASADGLLAEHHQPETHLIPCLLHAMMTKRLMTVYGNDYDTPDGTCVRDYVHVEDLAQAHLLALEHLWQGGGSQIYNVGNGEGYSILEVIQAVEEVTGQKVPYVFGRRRDGDPPRLVADASRIKSDLGWKPAYPELKTMVAHAWKAGQWLT